MFYTIVYAFGFFLCLWMFYYTIAFPLFSSDFTHFTFSHSLSEERCILQTMAKPNVAAFSTYLSLILLILRTFSWHHLFICSPHVILIHYAHEGLLLVFSAQHAFSSTEHVCTQQAQNKISLKLMTIQKISAFICCFHLSDAKLRLL